MERYKRKFKEDIIDQEIANKIYKILDSVNLEYDEATTQYLNYKGPAGHIPGFAIRIRNIFATWIGRGNEPQIISNVKTSRLKDAASSLPIVLNRIKKLEKTLPGYSIELTAGSLDYISIRIYNKQR